MSDPLPSTSVALMGSGVDAVTLPSKLTVVRGPGMFELSWRWREQVTRDAFLTPFVGGSWLVWQVLAQGVTHGLLTTLAAVGPLAVLAALVIAAWARNVMRVRVEQGALMVRSGPVSAHRGWEVLAPDIAEIVVLQPRGGNAGRDRWAVGVLLKSGRQRSIVGAMLKQHQAEAIAELIRGALRGEEPFLDGAGVGGGALQP